MQAQVLAIQQFYPQVFHACHVAHARARSTAFRLSERDSAILSHVLPDWPATARDLARHLGIGAPAMSAALLATLSAAERGAAVRGLQLLARGARAVAQKEECS